MAIKINSKRENYRLFVGSKGQLEITTDSYTFSNGSTHIKIVANDGYVFQDTPTVTANNTTYSTWDVTNTDTEKEMSIYLNTNATVNAVAVLGAATTYYILNTALENATCNISDGTTAEENSEQQITVEASDGYYFKTVPTITMGETVIEMLTDDTADKKTRYYYNLTVTGDATITASAVDATEYHFNVNLTNATCNISPDTVYEIGDTVHVTVKANNGYYFATAPTISFLNKYGATTKYTMETEDTSEYKQNFYYDITLQSGIQLNVINISGDGQVMPDVDKYGIITIYNPTATELKEIGEVRYMKTTDSSVDLGDYITSLRKVYVKIPKNKTANVLLGGYNTNVECNAVTNDLVETDCGTVKIVGNYNNAMDYENTKIEIYLPLKGFQQLEPEKVMNETLSLVYKTNVINGDSIACIYNTTGTLLYTFNCNASFEIPYRLNDELESKGSLEVNGNYLFGFTPFITVRYNKAYNTADVIANDNRETFIKNESGYIKCSEVFNTVSATATEKAEIETLLKEGVIL